MSRHRRGQAAVEFSIVLVTVGSFIVLTFAYLWGLSQNWILQESVKTLGTEIVTTGTYSEGTFVGAAFDRGMIIDPGVDQLIITVTAADGTTDTYGWGASEFNVAYGDLVTIEATHNPGTTGKESDIPGLSPPVAHVTWSGIAQRNTPDQSPDGLPPEDVGEITGRVTDIDSGAPIAGVAITLSTGGYSAQTDLDGRYVIANVEPGTYTAYATATGYQGASGTVTVTGNGTTTRNFIIQAAVVIDIAVTTENSPNRVDNTDFEAGLSNWQNGAWDFAAGAIDFAPSSDAHSGSFGAVITSSGSVAQGIHTTVTATFTTGISYQAKVWVRSAPGTTIEIGLGTADGYATNSVISNGGWQQLIVSWTPSVDATNAILAVWTDPT